MDPILNLSVVLLHTRQQLHGIHYRIIKGTFPIQLLLKTGLKNPKNDVVNIKFGKGGGSVVYFYYFGYIMTHLFLI